MTDADPYIDAWLRHEPEMALALTITPAGERRLLSLWGALLHQLCEATFDIGELQVAQAKLAWWQAELEHGRGGCGNASHPLVRALFALEPALAVRADRWNVLTGTALAQAGSDQVASDTDEMLASRHSIANAVAGVEADLFSGLSDIGAIQRNLVMRQLRRSPAGFRWPLQLRARLQLGADTSDPAARAALAAELARELPDSPPSVAAAVLFRRLRSGIDQWQLSRLRARGSFATRLSPRLAWNLWRAARAGA